MINEINLEKLSITKNTYSSNPPTNLYNYGIVDTGETLNYIMVRNPCSINQKTTNDIQVILPSISLTQDTHREVLNITTPPTPESRTEHISPHLQ